MSSPSFISSRASLGLLVCRPHCRSVAKPVFALILVWALAGAPFSRAQSFGGGISRPKKITIHRKLPAAITLTNISTFSVSANARAKDQDEVVQSLSDILETEILKYDKRLQSQKSGGDLLISCTITHYETPPQQTSTRNETQIQNGHAVQIPKQYYRLVGELEVSYQAKDRKTSRVLDSQNVSAKYNHEFEQGSNQASDKSIGAKITDPFKKLAGKKVEGDDPPPTNMELRLKLIHDVVGQITHRLVNTDEPVEILLARGKQLDDADKIAENGLWSRYLESLETMTPFPAPRDDAYRLYNIGVANEALAYQSEDRAAAKKFLEEAAINYGKAIDARPDEKGFLEPQTRIETAVAYYKKLEEHLPEVAKADPASGDPSAASSGSRSVKSSSSKGSSGTKTTAARAKTINPTANSLAASPPSSDSAPGSSSVQPKAATKASGAPAAPALTNQKVIDMLKGGVDEDNIIATIHDAPSVDFDLSPDGQIALAKNGVKGKLLAAMRERARRPNRAK